MSTQPTPPASDTPPAAKTRHIAVYWDFENIHIECSKAIGLVPGKNAVQSHSVAVEPIMRHIKSLGIVSLCRAYADWRHLSIYAGDLLSHSIQLVQMFPSTGAGKNSADIQMCLDILADSAAFPHLDTVVIIAGDSDYIPLIQKLRARGIHVIGIGVLGSTGHYLPKACDEFKFYHNLSGRTTPATPAPAPAADTTPSAPAGTAAADDAGTAAPAATPPPPPAPAPEKHPPETAEEKPAEISPPPETPDLDTVTKLLDDAYAQAANDCGEDVTLAMLKSIMIQIDPTFDTANYGYKGPESLQKLIEAVGGYKMIDPHRIRKIKPAAHHKFSAATLEKYKEGSVVKGKINHIAPIGILVFLEPGVTGIINTPNISWELPPPAYNLGDEVEAKVIAITAEPQRVVLSIKHLINNPWESFLEKYKEGDEVNGRIIDMNSFNVLIRLEEGITGIVHVSNISWEYVGHPADELKIGQKTKARILAIEPKMQRVSLSIKHLAEDPWERIHYEYHIGDTVRCTVTGQDRYNAGCFARIKKGLIAYIPQMNLTEPLIPGQQIEAAITLIDTSRRKLHLKPKPGLQNRLDL